MRIRIPHLLLLLSLTVITAAGCGSEDDTTAPGETADTDTTAPGETADTDTTDISVGLVFDIGGRGDQSFNDSAAMGVERAAAELGVSFTEAEPKQDGSDRMELLELAANAHDVVIAVGYLFEADAAVVASEYPDTLFGVVDTAMIDPESEPPGQPYGDNVSGLVFSEHQGSFLVGAAAAMKSQTGTIGFIGGVANIGGLIEKFQAGYEDGARTVNPDIEILSSYITEAPDFDGFYASDRAKEIALSMYEDSGADIIYHAAGGSGAGLFQAAKERSDTTGSKVWGIGVDSDQYNTVDPGVREYVLTSMLKRVDVAIFEMIKAAIDDSTTPGPIVYDLPVGGVGYSTTGGFIDDITEELEQYKERIIQGEIDVPEVPTGS